MNNFENALNILNTRQNIAQKKITAMNLVLKKNEEYASLCKQAKKLAFEEKDDKVFEEKSRLISKKMAEIQVEYGIDFDDAYFCKRCKDSGYLGEKKCKCLNDILSQLFYKSLDLPMPNLESFENSNLELFGKNKAIMQKVYDDVKVLANGDFDKNFIVFRGETGSGKTYLCKCFANSLIENEFTVLFVSAYSLFQFACNYFNKPNSQELLNTLQKVDFLFVDDFSAEHKTEYYTNFLLSLLSVRNDTNKKTVFTTNCKRMDVLNNYGERIFSRLYDKNNSIYFSLNNDDLRINNK